MMAAALLARCPACQAVVNPQWAACYACRQTLRPLVPGPRSSSETDWGSEWRALAKLAYQIGPDDPRYDPLLLALADCDRAYKAQDRDEYGTGKERIVQLLKLVPGTSISWKSADERSQGPATITDIIYEDGRLWLAVIWKGQLHWINELLAKTLSR